MDTPFHARDVGTMRDKITGLRYRILEHKHYYRVYEINEAGEPVYGVFGLVYAKSQPNVPRITQQCYLREYPGAIIAKPKNLRHAWENSRGKRTMIVARNRGR